MTKHEERLLLTRAIRRLVINRLAQILYLAQGVEDPYMYRASGVMVCPECDQMYYDHAADPLAPYLNVLCNGDRVKL